MDFEQGNFSIKHDEDRIIPLALRAQQVDPQPNPTQPNHHNTARVTTSACFAS